MTALRLMHPERYQGAGRRYPYFEGWYYKLVDASEERRYAVIPGIFVGRTPEESQCFVQFMDGATGSVAFYRYPLSAFSGAPDSLDLRVGPNRFTHDAVSLELVSEALTVQGSLQFEGVTPWPATRLSPGIMGPFSWVPAMECYHGIVSLDHAIAGQLRINGETVDLTRGRGYTEKDWGRRFPAAWIWFQSNHFDQVGTSLTASIAQIPWLGLRFPGFIVGLWLDGRLYRFATYTGAHVERLCTSDASIEWVLSDRQHRLSMRIARHAPGLLYAPEIADMSGRVGETLQATAEVTLTALPRRGEGDRLAFTGHARLGGLEVVGDTRLLGARVLGEGPR